jgi:Fic family protein
MSNKRTDAEKLDAISDALSDSLLGATDEEILEEARLIGLNTSVEAGRVRALMLGTVKAYQQRALREARQSYDAQAQQSAKIVAIPSTPAKRRELFSFVLAKQPQYAELFTAQHREFTDLTDSDIESYLEDLDELGVLEKLKPDKDDGDE